jgi:Cu(I)/Ag(I) efflux system membrane fusion protein
MKNASLYLLIGLLVACNTVDQKASTNSQRMILSGKSMQSEAFNQSFKKILDRYYQLKDHFIAENIPMIDSSANQLSNSMDSLLINELKADSTVQSTAKSYIDGISAEIKGLLGEKDIEAKRKSFQMISEQLYDLIRTVQYDQAIVYHAFCPMAFNNDGASWLSNTSIISNPYLPKSMLNCGEVRDSIDFRRKQ